MEEYTRSYAKTGLQHINATTLPLFQRLAQHRSELKGFLNGTNKHYCDSYKVVDIHAILRKNWQQERDTGSRKNKFTYSFTFYN